MNKTELLKLLEELPEDIELFHNDFGISIYDGEKFLGYIDFLHKKLILVNGENK